MSKLQYFICPRVGVEMARDHGYAFYQAQVLFEEELYSDSILISPGLGWTGLSWTPGPSGRQR